MNAERLAGRTPFCQITDFGVVHKKTKGRRSMGTSAVQGGIFFVIWLLMVGSMIIGWIMFIVAVWRGMKAHESIARSMKWIAERYDSE